MVRSARLLRREFRAMGTEIALIRSEGRGAERRLELAERWVGAYENRLSRFIPYSELSRLNRSAGKPFRASPLLFAFVRMCQDLAERSAGVFDPTLLHEIEAAGYDRTFDMITSGPGPTTQERTATFRDIKLDARSRTITLPAGLGIDSGGLGKGWAADRIARFLGPDCLVDCGGDIAAGGTPADGGAWYVGMQDPFEPEHDLAVLGVSDRGVATSSTLKRRWPALNGFAHHLIDARTGQPSATDVAAVTVVAKDATMADFHAKVALLKGSTDGLDYLEGEREVEGLVIALNGSQRSSGGFDRYVVPP